MVAAFDLMSANLQRPVLDDKLQVVSWTADPAAVECKNRVIVDLPAFCFRVVMLERAKGQAKVAKSKAK
jgi:hypothetical protein